MDGRRRREVDHERHTVVAGALIWTVLLVALFAAGCSSDDDGEADTAPAAAASDQVSGVAVPTPEPADSGQAAQQQVEASIVFTSPAFDEIKRIPKKHTCTEISANVPNISPPLAWEAIPDGTVSMAVIVHSQEVEGAERVHWVMWNMPPTRTGLEEGVEHAAKLADGTAQGTNGVGEVGYLGPCPPVIIHRVRRPGRRSEEAGDREVLLQDIRPGHDARTAVVDHEGGPAEGHRRPRRGGRRAGGRTPGPDQGDRAPMIVGLPVQRWSHTACPHQAGPFDTP